ncbi:hypothetical protein [Breznakiella homolactica]|uniref:Uncharacterized protein n=1 Tax=Breznakiella homolactica TaxID=2798577 RepID=A0A7T7XM00_9SPIR|nr:hypothetical protein [Breznakiella homolactica]QQO08662.1 hypothetical protein JFL75_17295 [Breznakiella homolactica]
MFFLTERPDLIHMVNGFFQLFAADGHYTDGETLRFGNVEVTPRHCPGHTPGTYSFFFYMEESGKRYRCGMHGGMGVNTLTGVNPFIEPGGFAKQMDARYQDFLKYCQ